MVLVRLVVIEEEDGLVHYKYRDLEAGSDVEGKLRLGRSRSSVQSTNHHVL